MPKKDIVAIGGSAGSGAALRRLFAGFSADFPGSIFVSTHIATRSSGYLATMLDGAGPLPVIEAVDGQPIEPGRAYVAAPDNHLLVIEDSIRLGSGPRENMSRPAIDPLFRSVALTHGPRAVGVILSGMLNDGAAGLAAIKACGGTAIVQHPLDAEADEMPLAALEAVEPDHVVEVKALAALLGGLAQADAGGAEQCPEGIELEVDIAMGRRLGAKILSTIAAPSPLGCPDCRGVLSEIKGEGPLRYRCQTGHAYSAETLAAQTEELDEALRIALRAMEERVTLVTRMSDDARQTGRSAVAELYETRAEEYVRYAHILREAAIRSHRASTRAREPDI